jgi:hypothetical protein
MFPGTARLFSPGVSQVVSGFGLLRAKHFPPLQQQSKLGDG